MDIVSVASQRKNQKSVMLWLLECKTKVDKPDDFVDCGGAQHEKWTTTSEIDLHALWATTSEPPAHHPHHRNVDVSSTGRKKKVSRANAEVSERIRTLND